MLQEIEMTDYNDGKWHNWDGGECPVHKYTHVWCVVKEGTVSNIHAESANWSVGGVEAFKVINEYKEPREFWLFDGEVYSSKEGAEKDQFASRAWREGFEVIHVREVVVDGIK